ncbi:MAG: hypothetical protein DMF82_10570 [Acidobacteria bacterium]|nr:MAG: hypothetical protein DMF82_10570 [Acidobacteriota bacterium]
MRRALSFPELRPSWARGLSLGLAIGLAILLIGDRSARAITVNPGIDPLSILDLQVKPNVLFIIDTSGSMKWPTDTDNFSVGDDDPSSRIYQAKQAVDTVIQANASKMNFGLATYNILDSNKTLNRTTDFDGDAVLDGPLVYVSGDANAGQWLGTATTPASVTGTGYFNAPSGTFLTYSPQTSAGIFASLMNTNGTFIAAGYGYANAYPPGCTPGTTCRYYMQSKLFRSGTLYRWNRAAGIRSAGLVSTATITCPLPPAGLTGFNKDADGDGFADNPRPSSLRTTTARPCSSRSPARTPAAARRFSTRWPSAAATTPRPSRPRWAPRPPWTPPACPSASPRRSLPPPPPTSRPASTSRSPACARTSRRRWREPWTGSGPRAHPPSRRSRRRASATSSSS